MVQAVAHCKGGEDKLLGSRRDVTSTIPDWASWLGRLNDPTTNPFIRACTFTGRPCGADAFVKEVEKNTHRDFTRKKPGPKTKHGEQTGSLLDWSEDRILS